MRNIMYESQKILRRLKRRGIQKWFMEIHLWKRDTEKNQGDRKKRGS